MSYTFNRMLQNEWGICVKLMDHLKLPITNFKHLSWYVYFRCYLSVGCCSTRRPSTIKLSTQLRHRPWTDILHCDARQLKCVTTSSEPNMEWKLSKFTTITFTCNRLQAVIRLLSLSLCRLGLAPWQCALLLLLVFCLSHFSSIDNFNGRQQPFMR